MRVFEEEKFGMGQEYVWEDELSGFGEAMTTGEVLIGMKLDNVSRVFGKLGYTDKPGVRKAIAVFKAVKNDVLKYIGKPKAGILNKAIDKAVARHQRYYETKLSAGHSSKRWIKKQIPELRGILSTPMTVTVGPPQVPKGPEAEAVREKAPEAVPGKKTALAKAFDVKKLIVPGVVLATIGFFVTKFLTNNTK